MSKSNATMCEGTNCPVKELCARYLSGLNRLNTYHLDPIPYNHDRQKCGQFVPKETDTFNDSISDYEERENEPPLNKPK